MTCGCLNASVVGGGVVSIGVTPWFGAALVFVAVEGVAAGALTATLVLTTVLAACVVVAAVTAVVAEVVVVEVVPGTLAGGCCCCCASVAWVVLAVSCVSG